LRAFDWERVQLGIDIHRFALCIDEIAEALQHGSLGFPAGLGLECTTARPRNIGGHHSVIK